MKQLVTNVLEIERGGEGRQRRRHVKLLFWEQGRLNMHIWKFENCKFEKKKFVHYFFIEGPRSRCNGRTAALRLIVQPCDEDEEVFFCFSILKEHWWNDTERGN
jgi:hypothetical protein